MQLAGCGNGGRLLPYCLTRSTLLVEPGKRVFELVVRQAFPQGRGDDVLREIVAELEP